MASKNMTIAFPRGGLLPGSLFKAKKDIVVPPHEPVDVPATYGQQLIDDKFAYDATEMAATNAKAAAEAKAVADAQVAADARQKLIDDAQAAVDAATTKFAGLAGTTDDAAKAAAEANLKAAQDALAALKA